LQPADAEGVGGIGRRPLNSGPPRGMQAVDVCSPARACIELAAAYGMEDPFLMLSAEPRRRPLDDKVGYVPLAVLVQPNRT
jgi:hypothetical protein